MESQRKGNAAEAAVLSALVARRFQVLIPFGGGQPYDLVVDLGTEGFFRIQCKAARERDGCVVFNSRTTDHGRGRMSYVGLADVFGVYLASTDSVFIVPVEEASGFRGTLRLRPARNNQQRGVRIAAEYEMDRWTRNELATVATGAWTRSSSPS